MIVGSWQYKISNDRAMSGYKIVSKYAEKYGAIGTSIATHQGADTSVYNIDIGYNNYQHFGEMDDSWSTDSEFGSEMEAYFGMSEHIRMNFYEPLLHEMPFNGVKSCFAIWKFSHPNRELVLKESESFFKYWMDNGSTGCTVGTLSGADFGQYAFGARFNNMADYGKAADKLNGDKVWDNHQEMLSSTIWDGFNLRRVLAENGWKE
jgi:hypothetical protein